MADDGQHLGDRSVADLLKQASDQTATLVHQELELAKAELTTKGKQAGPISTEAAETPNVDGCPGGSREGDMKRDNTEFRLGGLEALRRDDRQALLATLDPGVVWQGLEDEWLCARWTRSS